MASGTLRAPRPVNEALEDKIKMICPKCKGELNHSQQGPYTCRFCNGCEGIWISGKEINKILRNETEVESFEGVSEFLEGEKEQLKNGSCPECSGQHLNVRIVKGVELDICGKCNGVFFDKNELSNIFTKGLGDPSRSDAIAYGSVEATIQVFVALIKGLG